MCEAERKYTHCSIGDEQGVALIAALLLVVVVSAVGTSLLVSTSTEIKISGNHKRAVQNTYVAEAGAEEARARLRGVPDSNSGYIRDPVIGYDPGWSAYIITSAEWSSVNDPEYDSRLTNYVPESGSQTNTSITANSLQARLPYWTKIKHKTEYDAEKLGHRPATPHYVDGDGNVRRHTVAKPGNVIYYGYPKAGLEYPVQFTGTASTVFQPVELISAYSENSSGKTVIQVEVVHDPGPPRLGLLYSRSGVSFSGPPGFVDGNDQCGALYALPPVFTKEPSNTVGEPIFAGNPLAPQKGPNAIDIVDAISRFKSDAVVLTTDHNGRNFGTASNYVTVYADTFNPPNTAGMVLSNSSGYGILLVMGDLSLAGSVKWNGLILVSGTLHLNGMGSGIQIRGAVWADRIIDQSGILDIRYDSCQVHAALAAKPLRIIRWKGEL